MRATTKYDRNSIYHSPVPTRATQRVLARPRDLPHGSVASTMAAGGRAVRAGQGEARIESLVLSDGLIFARPWRRRPAGTDARLAILRLMPSKQLREKGATPGGINIYTPCSFEPIGLSRVQSTGDWRHQTAAGRHRQSTRH